VVEPYQLRKRTVILGRFAQVRFFGTASRRRIAISTFYDAGFDWKLGDYMNGYKAEGNARDVEGAVAALRDAAVRVLEAEPTPPSPGRKRVKT
jgi:hypothetical protein